MELYHMIFILDKTDCVIVELYHMAYIWIKLW